MAFLQPKIKPDPALVAQRESERALTAKRAQRDIGAEQDRLTSMFGGRSLLAAPTSGGSTGGTMASLGSNWLGGMKGIL